MIKVSLGKSYRHWTFREGWFFTSILLMSFLSSFPDFLFGYIKCLMKGKITKQNAHCAVLNQQSWKVIYLVNTREWFQYFIISNTLVRAFIMHTPNDSGQYSAFFFIRIEKWQNYSSSSRSLGHRGDPKLKYLISLIQYYIIFWQYFSIF